MQAAAPAASVKGKELLTAKNKNALLPEILRHLGKANVKYLIHKTKTAREKKLKTRMQLMLKGRATPKELSDLSAGQEEVDIDNALIIIFEHLPKDVKMEVEGKEVHEVWTYINDLHDNEAFEVYHANEDDYERIKPAAYKSMELYVNAKRAQFLYIKKTNPTWKSEDVFLQDIIRDCRTVGGELLNEVKSLYRELQEKKLDYTKLKRRLVAAETLSQYEPDQGSSKNMSINNTLNETNTALVANTALVTKLKRMEKDVSKLKKEKAYFSRERNNKRRKGAANHGSEEKKNCYNYEDNGFCSWGEDCHFLHNGRKPTDDDREKKKRRNRNNKRKGKDDKRRSHLGRRKREELSDDEDDSDQYEQGNIAKHNASKHRNRFGLACVANDDEMMKIDDDETHFQDDKSYDKSPRLFQGMKLIPLLVVGLLSFFVLMTATAVNRLYDHASTSLFTSQYLDINVATTITTSAVMGGTMFFAFDQEHKTSNETNENPIALVNTMQRKFWKFISDSGATGMVLGDEELIALMYNTTEIKSGVIMMNANPEPITLRGTIDLHYPVDGTNETETVPAQAMAVPTSDYNLWSVTSYMDENMGIWTTLINHFVNYFSNKVVVSLPSGRTSTFSRKGKLYPMMLPRTAGEHGLNATSTLPEHEVNTPEKSKKQRRRQQKKRRRKLRLQQRNESDTDIDDNVPELTCSSSESEDEDGRSKQF